MQVLFLTFVESLASFLSPLRKGCGLSESPSPGVGDALAFFIVQVVIQVVLLFVAVALVYGLLKEKE